MATALGTLLYFKFPLAIIALAVFALVLKFKNYVSLASVTAVGSVPVIACFMQMPEQYISALFVISLLVIFRHKDNLKRLSEGTENKFRAA